MGESVEALKGAQPLSAYLHGRIHQATEGQGLSQSQKQALATLPDLHCVKLSTFQDYLRSVLVIPGHERFKGDIEYEKTALTGLEVDLTWLIERNDAVSLFIHGCLDEATEGKGMSIEQASAVLSLPTIKANVAELKEYARTFSVPESGYRSNNHGSLLDPPEVWGSANRIERISLYHGLKALQQPVDTGHSAGRQERPQKRAQDIAELKYATTGDVEAVMVLLDSFDQGGMASRVSRAKLLDRHGDDVVLGVPYSRVKDLIDALNKPTKGADTPTVFPGSPGDAFVVYESLEAADGFETASHENTGGPDAIEAGATSQIFAEGIAYRGMSTSGNGGARKGRKGKKGNNARRIGGFEDAPEELSTDLRSP